MPIVNKTFLGLADIYLKPFGGSGGHRPIGSVSACQLTHSEEEVRARNYGREGGTLNAVRRLDQVGVSLTLQSLSIPNLAQALRGTPQSIEAGTVTDEPYTATLGELIRLPHLSPTSVVVKSGDGVTTYGLNTDYKVVGAGVIPLEGGSIVNGPVLISYAYGAQQVVQALTGANSEYGLVFDGINEAENNQVVVVDLYRIKFGLPESLDLIGDEFATLSITGELLLDASQTGAGASKFYRWAYAGAT
jgi:hypothetical protein